MITRRGLLEAAAEQGAPDRFVAAACDFLVAELTFNSFALMSVAYGKPPEKTN